VEPVLLEGIRGEHASRVGYMNYYASEAIMKKYHPEPGKPSPEYRRLKKLLNPLSREMADLGKIRWDEYTTWGVRISSKNPR
jgi:hypothetical protein